MNKVANPEYYVYRQHIFSYGGGLNQAKLLTPSKLENGKITLGEDGEKVTITSAIQFVPYGGKLKLTYQVNPKAKLPDYFFETNSFNLYSERLIELMNEYKVKMESFPVKIVDKEGVELTNVKYYIFHNLEGVIDVMDETKSEWTGDRHIGVPRLSLDLTKFVPRPLFVADKLFCGMISRDLKEEIEKRNFTGFDFLDPKDYRSGKYGFPNYTE